MKISLTPPRIAAAIFDLNGFQTLYSIFSPVTLSSTDILFSLYTDSPGTKFLVTRASYNPFEMKTPSNL